MDQQKIQRRMNVSIFILHVSLLHVQFTKIYTTFLRIEGSLITLLTHLLSMVSILCFATRTLRTWFRKISKIYENVGHLFKQFLQE